MTHGERITEGVGGMTEYEKFIERMKELGASKPYMSEKDFNEFHGIETEEKIPVLKLKND